MAIGVKTYKPTFEFVHIASYVKPPPTEALGGCSDVGDAED